MTKERGSGYAGAKFKSKFIIILTILKVFEMFPSDNDVNPPLFFFWKHRKVGSRLARDLTLQYRSMTFHI